MVVNAKRRSDKPKLVGGQWPDLRLAHPRMLLDLLKCVALVRVNLQASADQILAVGGRRGAAPADGPAADLVVPVEWDVATADIVKKNAQGPALIPS